MSGLEHVDDKQAASAQPRQTVSIGLINPKSAQNVGSVVRAAGCYGAASVFFSGQRYAYARQYRTDTHSAAANIPVIGCNDLQAMRPSGATTVAVELTLGATPLPAFRHPANAFYVFGPEDGSIGNDDLDWCDEVVYIPTYGCMNLAATVNVVLYDRLAKSPVHPQTDDDFIRAVRDTNNRGRRRT